jgi:hypothetical protein
MTSRRNPKLKEFVAEVRKEDELIRPGIPILAIDREATVAAADYIDTRLRASSKGGTRSRKKPKPGRPITNKTRAGALSRARSRRYRENKEKAK